MMKVILRNSSHDMINIPDGIWKKAGWKINDECLIYLDKVDEEDSDWGYKICISRVPESITSEESK